MRRVLNNNKLLLFVVAVSLLANIVMLIYFVWSRESSRRNLHREKQISPIALFLEKQVGFNQQQMAAYNELRQQNRKKMSPLFEDIRLTKVRFYQYLKQPDTPDSVLKAGAALIGDKQSGLDFHTFQNFKQVRTLCTPEQRLKYDSLISGVIEQMWFPVKKNEPHHKEDSQAPRHN